MKSKIKFEDALSELEKIVEELESPATELERSIELFEKGVALARLCTKTLQDAKNKIEMISVNGDKVKKTKFSAKERAAYSQQESSDEL
ncbi:MAG: exodeoxyribonuclease VII small subunit [Endomicrobiales bacterium]|nr:exodeoxyribonuclease VII small subunit [Endomicrobiales bacterium]